MRISNPLKSDWTLIECMFEKHCQICGVDVKKETTIKRFGKHFCNDGHANQFVAKIVEEEKRQEEYRKSHPRRGGCC